jgi:hypothetical protein
MVGTTCKDTLAPTPARVRELARVLLLCRRLYTVAREQRTTVAREQRTTVAREQRTTVAREQRSSAGPRCPVTSSREEQEAALKAIRAEMAEAAALQAQRLQAVLARLATTSAACLRRVPRGEQAGFLRLKGRPRCHSFPCTPLPLLPLHPAATPAPSFPEDGKGGWHWRPPRRRRSGVVQWCPVVSSVVQWCPGSGAVRSRGPVGWTARPRR